MAKKNKLILVNRSDRKIGEISKEKAHKELLLHRANTVFILNDKDQLLITMRSKNKELWPLSWESSCSTHVYVGETYKTAGERRIKEELGIRTNLQLILKFKYTVKYKNASGENEMCALLVGKYNGKLWPNEYEIKRYKWIGLDELEKEINSHPEKFAPWLKIALSQYMNIHKG